MNLYDTGDNGLQLHDIAATMVVDAGSSNLGGTKTPKTVFAQSGNWADSNWKGLCLSTTAPAAESPSAIFSPLVQSRQLKLRREIYQWKCNFKKMELYWSLKPIGKSWLFFLVSNRWNHLQYPNSLFLCLFTAYTFNFINKGATTKCQNSQRKSKQLCEAGPLGALVLTPHLTLVNS